MAEVQELRDLVEKLQSELVSLKDSQDGEQFAKQYVGYKQERKVKKFNGKAVNDTSFYEKVEEFIAETNAIFETRKMTTPEKVEFILTHLEGPAREEIRLYPKTDQNDPKKLLDILKKEFGEKHSLPELFKIFYNRKQKDEESLREYSHALSSLFERIIQKSPSPSDRPSDITVRDQFVNNVKDHLLRKELKKLVRSNPLVSFLDVREEALKWSEEEVTAKSVTNRREASTRPRSDNDVACKVVSASGTSELKEIQGALSRQQKLIEDLVKTVKTLEGKNKAPKEWKCYSCNEPGHIARNCPVKKSRSQNPPQTGEGDKSSGPSNRDPPQH